MASYTQVFGGNTIRAADVSLTSLALTSNSTLSWPGTGQSPFTSAIVEVTPSGPGLWLRMPDATLVSEGESVTFRNLGASSFALQDSTGGSIVTVGSGQAHTVYLRDNATAAGSWASWQAGAGTSSADAGSLDGAGLEASSGVLRVSAVVNSYTTSQAFSDGDRGSFSVWTGGSGTFTVPAASSVGDGWFMHFKNSGSGTLQIDSAGSETFDGNSDITLANGESATVFSDGTNFSYISSVSSAGGSEFGYTAVAIGGTGNYTLSAAEYAKNAIKLTGTLTGNRNVIVPTAVRDYWINNATSGAYTVTVKTASGSGVLVTQGKKATVYCDGTDVIAADTDYPSGVATPVVVADGGTGATDADTALTNLGGTTTGKSIFTAANAAAVRTAAGLGNAATLDETTAAQFRNNTADKLLSTDQVWSAADRVALTWTSGGNTAVDLSLGINFTVTTATGNSTLAAPTNAKTGQSGFIEITQDGTTPRTLAFNAAWVFDGGVDPTLTATASAKDILYYTVLNSTGPVIHATLRKAVA